MSESSDHALAVCINFLDVQLRVLSDDDRRAVLLELKNWTHLRCFRGDPEEPERCPGS